MLKLRSSPRVLNSFWHRWSIRRRARKEGKLSIPELPTTDLTPYEKLLVSQAQQVAENLDGSFSERINRLQKELYSHVERMERYTGQFQAKFRRLDRKMDEIGRGVTVHLSHAWYMSLLLLIVIGELAFNFQAFQVFQKPLALTLLMALAVAVTLPASAHFIGIWLKQWPKPLWRTALYVAASLVVGVGAMVGINIARSEYLRLLDVQLPKDQDVLQYSFLLVNLLVYCTAILMSYFAHDADPEIEKLRSEFRELDAKCRAANESINVVTAQLATARAERETEFRTVEAILGELLQIYWTANQLARSDHSCVNRVTTGLLNRQSAGDADRVTQEQMREIKERWTAVDKKSRSSVRA